MNLELSLQFRHCFYRYEVCFLIQILIVRCVALILFFELVQGKSIAGKKSKPAKFDGE